MARTKRKVKPLPTIWRVPEELWRIIKPVLDELDPPAATGRKRTDQRSALDGIIYQMRTGCQAVLVEQCDELGGVDWQWQAADGAMGKARFGGTLSGETPRVAVSTVWTMLGKVVA